MDANHPSEYDLRPKRRRDKDNPYELLSIGADTPSPHYYVRFKDVQGKEHCLEISKNLFDEFNGYELEDISYMNEDDRHYEHSELSEETLNEHAATPQESVEAIVGRRLEVEQLHQAMKVLPEIQRRRLVLHYFADMTYTQIASLEKCSYPVVRRSILAAVENLKKFLR